MAAQLVASRINPDSIYSIKLRRRGALGSPREPGTLDFVLVADAMSEEFASVPPDLPLTGLAERAREERTRSWVVLDGGAHPVGIVSVTDLEQAILEGEMEERSVLLARVQSVMGLAIEATENEPQEADAPATADEADPADDESSGR